MNHYLVGCEWLYRDYEVQVVPLRFADSIADIGRPRLTKALRAVPVWMRIASACLFRRPSIAYFTFAPSGFALWRDAAFLAILKSFRIPTLLHIHGKGLGPGQAPATARRIYRWAFQGSTVICLSDGLYQEVQDLVPREHHRVLPNGVPDISAAPTDQQVTSTRPKLLFLSNLMVEKGVFDLLQACSVLHGEGVSVDVTYVGPFPDAATHEQFDRRVAELNASSFVRWAGSAYGEDRIPYLRNADAFVFPSYYKPEAFPLVILEAMAAGLPVVAAKTGAIPEIVIDGETGILVEPRDPRSLANALRRIVEDSGLRSRMGAAGRQRYEEEYGLPRYLERMRLIFAEAAKTATAADGRPQHLREIVR